MSPRPPTLVTVLLLATTALAQITPTTQLVGWSATTGPALFTQVQMQDFAACTPARQVCRTLIGGSQWYGGGTAYDPRTQSVWISSGANLQQIALADGSVLCSAQPLLMNPQAVVSGLAMLDGGGRLLQLETAPGYAGLISYHTGACPPAPLRDGCSLVLPQGAVAAGLAYDPVHDLVLFTVSTPTAIDWLTELRVARNNARCQPLCSFPLPLCGPFQPRSGAITGLAYDPCKRTAYATNGKHTLALAITDAATCRIQPGACCAVQSTAGFDFLGLDVVPGWAQARTGASCAAGMCASCPSLGMVLAGGDPAIGNPEFHTRLERAQVGARGVLVLGAGGCTSGTSVPFLCGPIHPALGGALYVSPPISATGSAPPCGATMRHPLPIPVDAALCGQKLCAQWLAVCGGAAGHAVSDAIGFSIAGS